MPARVEVGGRSRSTPARSGRTDGRSATDVEYGMGCRRHLGSGYMKQHEPHPSRHGTRNSTGHGHIPFHTLCSPVGGGVEDLGPHGTFPVQTQPGRFVRSPAKPANIPTWLDYPSMLQFHPSPQRCSRLPYAGRTQRSPTCASWKTRFGGSPPDSRRILIGAGEKVGGHTSMASISSIISMKFWSCMGVMVPALALASASRSKWGRSRRMAMIWSFVNFIAFTMDFPLFGDFGLRLRDFARFRHFFDPVLAWGLLCYLTIFSAHVSNDVLATAFRACRTNVARRASGSPRISWIWCRRSSGSRDCMVKHVSPCRMNVDGTGSTSRTPPPHAMICTVRSLM